MAQVFYSSLSTKLSDASNEEFGGHYYWERLHFGFVQVFVIFVFISQRGNSAFIGSSMTL